MGQNVDLAPRPGRCAEKDPKTRRSGMLHATQQKTSPRQLNSNRLTKWERRNGKPEKQENGKHVEYVNISELIASIPCFLVSRRNTFLSILEITFPRENLLRCGSKYSHIGVWCFLIIFPAVWKISPSQCWGPKSPRACQNIATSTTEAYLSG